jgi:hypothetical protein
MVPNPDQTGPIRHAFRDRLYDLEIRRVICSTNAIVISSATGHVAYVHHEAAAA